MAQLAVVSDRLDVYNFNQNNLTLKSSFQNSCTSLYCMSWNHSNQVVAVGGYGNELKVDLVQADNGQMIYSLQLQNYRSNETGSISSTISNTVKSVSFSGNSRYLTASVQNTVQVWDLKRRQIKSLLKNHLFAVTCTAFNINGDVLSGDQGGHIRIWDSKTFSSIHELSDKLDENSISNGLNSNAISALKPCPTNAAVLAAGYSSGSLCIWDILTSIPTRRQLVHNNGLTSITYSPRNSKLVATTGNDGRIALIDTSSKNDSVASIDVGERLNAVSFTEDAYQCAVGSHNGRVLIYDWRSIRSPITEAERSTFLPIYALNFEVSRAKSEGTSISSQTQSIRSSLSTDIQEIEIGAKSTAAKTQSPILNSIDNINKNNNNNNHIINNDKKGEINLKDSSYKVSTSTDAITSHTTASNNIDKKGWPSNKVNNIEHVSSPKITTATVASKIENKEKSIINNNSPLSETNNDNNNDKIYKNYSKYSSTTNSKSFDEQQDLMSHNFQLNTSNIGQTTRSLKSSSVEKNNENYSINNNIQNNIDYTQYNSTDPIITQHVINDKSPKISSIKMHKSEKILSPSGIDNEEYSSLKRAIRPVTITELEEALQGLKYDIHREVQDIIKEQIRQFSIAKDDTAELIKSLSNQIAELMKANEELRKENEYIHKIF
eukprot:gene11097-14892_t